MNLIFCCICKCDSSPMFYEDRVMSLEEPRGLIVFGAGSLMSAG